MTMFPKADDYYRDPGSLQWVLKHPRITPLPPPTRRQTIILVEIPIVGDMSRGELDYHYHAFEVEYASNHPQDDELLISHLKTHIQTYLATEAGQALVNAPIHAGEFLWLDALKEVPAEAWASQHEYDAPIYRVTYKGQAFVVSIEDSLIPGEVYPDNYVPPEDAENPDFAEGEDDEIAEDDIPF